MPDGIDEDALAPYSPHPYTLMCNTTRTLGTAAFSQDNNCLYYEMNNVEDRNASGAYMRLSEDEAQVMIFGDDVYTVEYKLKFKERTQGTVTETLSTDSGSATYTGTFTLQ